MQKTQKKTPDEFWSIESTPPEIKQPDNLTYLGEKIFGERMDHKHIFWMDKDGNGWYETKILIREHWVSPEIAIFGRKIKNTKK